MTESEFTQRADAIFLRIEKVLDDLDIEYSLTGNVMEIEFDDNSKIIINRHTPNQEIWVAAKSGGFHFGLQDKQWLSRRDGSELLGKLGELVRIATGKATHF